MLYNVRHFEIAFCSNGSNNDLSVLRNFVVLKVTIKIIPSEVYRHITRMAAEQRNPKFSQQELIDKLKKVKNEYFHKCLRALPTSYEKILPYQLQTIKDLDEILNCLTVDDEWFPKFVTIQGYHLLLVAYEWMRVNPEKYVLDSLPYMLKCENLLRPLKHRQEGIWLYNKCLLFQGDFYGKKLDYLKQASSYEQAVENMKEYFNMENIVQPWEFKDVFGYDVAAGRELIKGTVYEDRDMIYNNLLTVGMQFDETSQFEKVDRLFVEHGVTMMTILLRQNRDIKKSIFSLYKTATIFLFSKHLAQANHLLAVAMFEAVEYRKSLRASQHLMIDDLISLVSLAFAKYGSCILLDSITLKEEGEIVEIHSDFKRLKDGRGQTIKFYTGCKRLVDAHDSLLVYENQFPSELTTDNKILKKVMRKTKLWLERGVEMNQGKCTVFVEEVTAALDEAKRFFSFH